MLSSFLRTPGIRHLIASGQQKIVPQLVVARSFSYQSGSNSSAVRAYPQYNIYGENCLLAFKIMTPQFRCLRSNTIVVDKKGRILLEWLPRLADGTISRDSQIRFALSPEEIGLVLDQLPQNQIELSRHGQQGGANASMGGESQNELPNKVLRITPGPGGSMTYTVDFELNGVGGQQSGEGGSAISGPLSVTAQLGEQRVVAELLQTSIPALVGWTAQLEIATDKAIQDAQLQNSQDRSAGGVPF